MNIIDLLSYVDSIDTSEVVFDNLPRRYAIDYYEHSIRKIISHLGQQNAIKSIYQIGSINSPGISDIDLIVVFDDSTTDFRYSYQDVFDEQDSYVIIHGLFGMPERIFRKLEYLIPIYSRRLLLGHSIIVEPVLSNEEKRALSITYALEYFIVNIMNLSTQFFNKRLKVRNLLCSLNGLVYDLDILYQGCVPDEAVRFCDTIAVMRKGWWRLQKRPEQNMKREFLRLCKTALRLMVETLHNLPRLLPTGSDSGGMSRVLRVGANGYVTTCNVSRYHSPPFPRLALMSCTLRLHEMSRFGSWMQAGRHIRDLCQGFYAVKLSIPDYVHSMLSGCIEGLSKATLKVRQNILEDYSSFMSRLIPQYGIYDILRWHGSYGVKWRVIRSVNSRLFNGFFEGK